MAGFSARTFKLIESSHVFSDRSKIFQYQNHNSSNSSESESFSCTNSLPSRESSVDLTPDQRLEPMLRKKHKEVQSLSLKLRKFDHLSFISGFISLVFSQLSCELNKTEYYKIQFMLIVSFIFTAGLVYSLFKSWKIYFSLNREKKLFSEASKKFFYRSSYFRYFLIEAFVYAVQPVPFLEVDFKVYQLNGALFISLNEILASFSLLRVFLSLKLLRHHSKWTNEHSSAICDLYAAKATEKYALKALLNEKPVQFMIPLLILSILVFSLALRIYERNFVSEESLQDYHYLWNSMWLISLTMTTVGFGDFYPKTHPGRFIAALSAYWGIFLVSLIILTLTNFSHFNPAEQRSYNFIQRIRLRNKSQNYASLFIAKMMEIFIHSSKGKFSKQNHVKNVILAKSLFKKFKHSKDVYLRVENSPEETLRIINDDLRITIEKIKGIIAWAKDFNTQIDNTLESQIIVIEYLSESRYSTQDIDECLQALRRIGGSKIY